MKVMVMNSPPKKQNASAPKIETMKKIRAAYVAAQKAGTVKTYLVKPVSSV